MGGGIFEEDGGYIILRSVGFGEYSRLWTPYGRGSFWLLDYKSTARPYDEEEYTFASRN